MSSDQSGSEVAVTTGKTPSKRSLDQECEKKVNGGETISQDSTTDAGLDGENPSKRMKIEAVDGEDTVEKNPLVSADNDDSESAKSPQIQPTNGEDGKGKGDNGARAGNDGVVPTDVGSSNDTGVAAIQRGNTLESSYAASPAVTRSRSTSTGKKKNTDELDAVQTKLEGSIPEEPTARWRVHQMAEDYTSLVGSMMYPATQFQNYGYNPEERQYPIEKVSLLGFMKSPLRRPSVIEKWSPYEIAIFEGSMLHYGKEFRSVSKQIGTKTTQEVIDFYYIWKKTAHYKKWKEQYISDEDLLDDTIYVPVKKPKR